MRIDHVALYVEDLDKMRRFYQDYLGAQANDLYHNKTTGLQTYFLTFEGGARLELMTRPDLTRRAGRQWPLGWTHLAFTLGSTNAVDALTATLSSAGYSVLSGPRTTGDNYYESCIIDPEGNQVELVA